MDEETLLAEQRAFYASGARPAATVSRKGAEAAQKPGRGSWGDLPGERVELKLDESDQVSESPFQPFKSHARTTALIGNVLERDTDADDGAGPIFKKPVDGTTLKPKKLDWRARKQSKIAANKVIQTDPPPAGSPAGLTEEIDKENRAKLAQMSEAEIMQERAELINTLSPELQRLLLAKVERASCPREVDTDELGEVYEERHVKLPDIRRKDEQTGPDTGLEFRAKAPAAPAFKDTASVESPVTPTKNKEDRDVHIHSASCLTEDDGNSVHFPRPSQPELDPASETFLQDLHKKYFPDLRTDPKSMAWMQNPSEAEDRAVYHPFLDEVDPMELRFDFAGKLLGPATSREIDTRLGLHHHADAPTAAGYTIPELAHLARSAMPAQACLAIQTAGRVMYRAARDGFGAEISPAVRNIVDKVQLEQVLLARTNDRHLGVRSLTTEALWLAHQSSEDTIRQYEV